MKQLVKYFIDRIIINLMDYNLININIAIKEIPKDTYYCYIEENGDYKPCPFYYKFNNKVGCSFVGTITDDFLLSDQVKICNK